MREFDRKIDWYRFSSVSNEFARFGYPGIKRNYGNGESYYTDISPGSEIQMIPLLGVIPFEKMNRVDFAFDYVFNGREMARFVSQAKSIMKIKATRTIKSETGSTVYFEGVKHLKVRIYQKGLKERSDEKNWVRLEFEVRGMYLRRILEESESYRGIFEYLLGRYTTLSADCKKIKLKPTQESFKEERFKNIRSELLKRGWEEDFLLFLKKSLDR